MLRRMNADAQHSELPLDALPFAVGRDLRSLSFATTVMATPARVFDAWTTPQGWRAFLGVRANVELRVGGPFELLFDEDEEVGQQGSEGCKIFGYVPDAMLFVSWNAPPSLPDERGQHTSVAVQFRDEGPGRTRVELRHQGFGEGGRWHEVIAYFERAWPMLLAALERHFGNDTGRADAKAPPRVELQSLLLAVSDLERSTAFYEQAFGWPRRIDAPVLVEFALPSRSGLSLYERGGFAKNTELAPEVVPEGGIAGTELYLRCDDLAAAIERLEAAGARPLSPRALRAWGDEAAYFADPDGNVVAVGCPAEG